jgi:phospholipid/cholesterol/gamma-HCH transport system substrate-binding protein
MKKQFLTEVRVGLFVLLGIVLVMVIIFMLGSEGKMFERHYTLYTKFKDISGLRVGAPVQLGGVRIGMVDGIHFSKDLAEKDILIELSLNKKYEDRVRADSIATINTQGLLGDKFIFVSVGSENQPMLVDESYIRSEETTPIFALAEKAGKIMDDIGAVTKSIRQMLASVEGKKEGDLRRTLKSLRVTMERIQTGPGLVHALIYDPEGKQVVENLSRTLKSIGDLTEDIDDDKQTKGLIANLRKASADLRKILAGIERGEGTVGKLVKDPELYNDLRTLLGRANRSKLIKTVVRATLKANDRQVMQ